MATKRRQHSGSGELLRAVSNEIRVDVLRILNERIASPKELAELTGLDSGLVSYHVRELLKEGCIELVRTEPRRGAVEHFYRAKVPAMFDDEAWAKLSPMARTKISTVVLQVLISEIAGAVHEKTFDARVDRHLSWMPFSVDEEGWEELTELFAEVLERAGRIRDVNAERLAESGDTGSRVIAAVLGFETPSMS